MVGVRERYHSGVGVRDEIGDENTQNRDQMPQEHVEGIIGMYTKDLTATPFAPSRN